jgi:hypothetical protein
MGFDVKRRLRKAQAAVFACRRRLPPLLAAAPVRPARRFITLP